MKNRKRSKPNIRRLNVCKRYWPWKHLFCRAIKMCPSIELFYVIFIDGQCSCFDGVRATTKRPWSIRKRTYKMPEEFLYTSKWKVGDSQSQLSDATLKKVFTKNLWCLGGCVIIGEPEKVEAQDNVSFYIVGHKKEREHIMRDNVCIPINGKWGNKRKSLVSAVDRVNKGSIYKKNLALGWMPHDRRIRKGGGKGQCQFLHTGT